MYGLGGAESFDHRRLPSRSRTAASISAHRQAARDTDREPSHSAGFTSLSSRHDALWSPRGRPLAPRKSTSISREARQEVRLGYGLAGRVNEIEGSEYFIARNEKRDIMQHGIFF